MNKDKAQAAVAALTNREQAVLRLIAAGFSNREIADQLVLSLHTVKWYIKEIFTKLGVARRTQAVAIAQLSGLFNTEISDFSPYLPAPMTAIIGREQELLDLNKLFDNPAIRLVTILGPGGIGKTLLALTLVHQQHTIAPGSIYFVALESLTAPDSIVSAIAQAIGVQFSGQLEPREQLVNALRRRHIILVLDNFEHLLPAGTFVSELLSSAPHLKILTTSRQKLNLHYETIFVLEGLSYSLRPKQLEDYSAIQLFIQTARRIQPSFQPNPETLLHINRICQLVEGMPLSIELACTWLDVLSPEQIAAEIEKSLLVLRTKSQDIPSRHRSIHAVFEHSWQLLSQEEQAAFSKLSVFQGGFNLEAAEAVAGTSFFMLSTLMDKSLVKRDAENRFKLHELIRQFASEKLRSNPAEKAETLKRHCQYFATMLHQIELDTKTMPSSIMRNYAKMRQDADNILVGWQWGVEHLMLAEIDQYTFSLSMLFEYSGLHHVTEEIFGLALQHLPPPIETSSPLAYIRLKSHYAWAIGMLMRLEQALTMLEAMCKLTKGLEGGAADVGQLYNFLGLLSIMVENYDKAQIYLEQGVTYCRRANYHFEECVGLTVLASIMAVTGDVDKTQQYYQNALALAEQHQIHIALHYILPVLGYIYNVYSDFDTGRSKILQILIRNKEFIVIASVFLTLTALATLYGRLNQREPALELLAIVLHHPQTGATIFAARWVLQEFHTLFPAEAINHVMQQAERGELASQYLPSDFIVDTQLIERLLELLNQTG